MTCGREFRARKSLDLDGAPVGHLAELVRGTSPRTDQGPLIRPSGTSVETSMVATAKKVGERRYRESFGRAYEDFTVGDIYEHARVISETFDESGRNLVVRALPATLAKLRRALAD